MLMADGTPCQEQEGTDRPRPSLAYQGPWPKPLSPIGFTFRLRYTPPGSIVSPAITITNTRYTHADPFTQSRFRQ